ncbi:MAG: class I SAM-dependent methyltransferase [Gammaproteobacteria bacterium]|nr:class I SAM-dependent methyltransferase [Gammaproteobacteria bacterium]
MWQLSEGCQHQCARSRQAATQACGLAGRGAKIRVMDFQLKQRGRASMHFLSDLAVASARLKAQVDADVLAKGLDEAHLAADLDQRLLQVDAALADSPSAAALAILSEHSGVNHGRVAAAAFDEVRPELEPRLQALMQGPTTIEPMPSGSRPDYADAAWIHRTTGGWDGHDYQGFIHGELIHREYVARTYPGDIFAQRRMILSVLPRKDYQRVFEIGTSSGHYTLQIAAEFPEAEIWGCDVSPRMLEQAQRAANERGLKWRLFVGAGEDTGLPDASVDLVTSYIVLHEIPAEAIHAQLREAFRLLRPGGDVLFSDVTRYGVLNKASVRWADYQAVHGGEPFWRESASLDLAAAAEAAGFTQVRSEGFKGAVYPWYVYGRKPE